MNTFLKQTRVYGNTIIRSKHNNNNPPTINSISFTKFNRCRSVAFRLGLVNYMFGSLDSLIKMACNNPSHIVSRKTTTNCFAISEIQEIWESYEETRDFDYIEELENILAYFSMFKEFLKDSSYNYQDQLGEDNLNDSGIPIIDYFHSFSPIAMPAFNELNTYYTDSDSDSD